jgi:hypothetical protein|tara:strand:+ start:98 stop:373 length:276 start_codon:yes stop_codon:yes gene_type:complete
MNKVNKLDNVQGIINNCNRDEINAIITMIKLKQSEFQYTAARQFAVGDRVSFESRKGNFLEGLIKKVNIKTIVVATNIGNWKVSPSLLTAI